MKQNSPDLKRILTLLIFVVSTIFVTTTSRAISPTQAELTSKAKWSEAHFGSQKATPPFAFTYDGKPSAEFIDSWQFKLSRRNLDASRMECTLVYSDPATNLNVRCVAIEYMDYPAIEWIVYFENTGDNPTPIIGDIKALDATFLSHCEGQFVLHHSKGSSTKADDYAPLRTKLGVGESYKLSTQGGRPSYTVMPYFNMEWPSTGVVCAVGWPGQWTAEFQVESSLKLRVKAGQELTLFKLEPGEEVRSPLIALVFWKGNLTRAHNLWRAWMFSHNMPHPGRRPVSTHLVACSSHQFSEMLKANENNQKLFIDRYLAEGLKIDYWWMDAGWYVNDGTWINTGTWEVDRKRFPNGLRAITNHGHSKGVKSIVWFEPERVTTNSWLYTQHPDWCLRAMNLQSEIAYQNKWRLLDLGNPIAWHWLVNHIDKIITEEGIDVYRQDFNMDPLMFWRTHDTSDRQGITEIRHVTGYLAFWDELRRRHPNLLIDSCASGGRRNDLETMRRAVPFLRSDFLFEPVSQQAHFYGVSLWLPHHGTGTIVGPSKLFKELKAGKVDTYMFRSHMSPTVIACWDMRRDDLDYARLRELCGHQLQRSAIRIVRSSKRATAQRHWMSPFV